MYKIFKEDKLFSASVGANISDRGSTAGKT